MGPSKQPKQIIQIEHNIVKNPNLLEADELAIYKRGRGFELGAIMKQIQVVVRVELETRAPTGFAPWRVRLHIDSSNDQVLQIYLSHTEKKDNFACTMKKNMFISRSLIH